MVVGGAPEEMENHAEAVFLFAKGIQSHTFLWLMNSFTFARYVCCSEIFQYAILSELADKNWN